MNFHNVSFLTSFGTAKQLPPPQKLEIAFAGRSNVGKSSLINKIFNRKTLARVSSMPGKTATINFFDFENLHIVDLPGYGYAKVAKTEKSRWAELIEGYFSMDRKFGLIVQLIDFRHKPSGDDLAMINFLQENELPYIIVLTKADKLSKAERANRLACFSVEIPGFSETVTVQFSAETAEGVDQLRAIITEIAAEEIEQQ
ncbi:MAG: ribosome biogenesis GTP-binding protein YihA/YsxC [Oscillospiraceae bacterium]